MKTLKIIVAWILLGALAGATSVRGQLLTVGGQPLPGGSITMSLSTADGSGNVVTGCGLGTAPNVRNSGTIVNLTIPLVAGAGGNLFGTVVGNDQIDCGGGFGVGSFYHVVAKDATGAISWTKNYTVTGARWTPQSTALSIFPPSLSPFPVLGNQPNTYSAGMKQTFTANSTSAGLNMSGLSADPAALVNGDFWYRSDLNRPRVRANGLSQSLAFLSDVTTSGALTKANVANQWISSYDASTGLFISTQISFTNLSGSWIKAQGPGTVTYTDQTNTYTAGMKQVFGASVSTAGVSFGGVAADPSTLVNGDYWYRSDLNRIRARANGVTQSVAWLSDIPTVAAVSKPNVANQWLNSYDATTGLYTSTQIGFTNLSGTATKAQQFGSTVYTDQSNGYTAGMKQVFAASATTAGFSDGGVAADPSSLVDGDIWYRTDTDRFSVRANSVTQRLAFLADLPANTPAVTNQFLTAYNSATGVLSQAAISAAAVPTLNQNTTGKATANVMNYSASVTGGLVTTPSNTNATTSRTTVPANITVISFTMALGSAFTGCTTFPTYQLFDVTASAVVSTITVTTGTIYFANTSLSAAVLAGHDIIFRVGTAAVGCTNGQSSTWVMWYSMT